MYDMGGEAFDLTQTISDLLKRIEEGRKAFKETQNVRDQFRSTCANRDKALQLRQEREGTMASLDDLGKSQPQAELDRLGSEYRGLADEAHRQLLSHDDTVAFIEPFHKDVKLLLDRLPLRPEWKEFREDVGCIDVRTHGCWTDPPANSALGTLEMRLRQMLKLAVRTQGGQVRPVDPFPTPNGAVWKEVSITFISEHRVSIEISSVTLTRSYAEMGFEDRRGGGGKPDSAWACLKLLAESAGKIERPNIFKSPGWPKVEKQVQALRAGLKKLFGIPGDPLPFHKRSGYEAQFKIKLGRSIEH